MSFAHPWVLVVGLLPIVVGVAQLLRRPRRVEFPFDHQSVSRHVVIEKMVKCVELLPLLSALLCALLLSVPQRKYFGETVREMRNIQILIDCSGSMSASFGGSGKNRHEAALDAVQQFVSHRKGDAFGLTLFAGVVIPWIPLTTDINALQSSLPFASHKNLPDDIKGGTATGHGISVLCDAFESAAPGERMIILVTDGLAGDIQPDTVSQLTDRMRKQKVTLYVILVGDEAGTPLSRQLCEPTGGQLFEAGDPAGLAAVFEHVDRMSTARMRPVAPGREDYFLPVSLVLLVVASVQLVASWVFRPVPW